MTESESDDSDEEQSPTYTVDVNEKRFALNEDFRLAIQKRAELEFEENPMFDCWWRVASQQDEEDPDTPHEKGDPLLVIETEGPIVPYDALDELDVEMVEEDNPFGDMVDSSSDSDDTNDIDSGGNMKSVPPEDVDASDDDEESEFERAHFQMTPRDFEETPQPESEEDDKIPPKPIKLGNEPALVWWVPRHPDSEERWETGEAIVPTHSWVEWNIQARADEIRFTHDGDIKHNSHNHFESLLRHHDCEKVGEYELSQDVPKDEDSGQVERKGKKAYEDGRFGGSNWNV